MKKNILLLLLLATSFVYSQQNEKACSTSKEKIKELLTDTKWQDAQDLWEKCLVICTNLDQNYFKQGETIYLYQIEMQNEEAKKLVLTQKLIDLYSLFDKKFPLNTNENGIKKALLLHENKIGNSSTIFSLLEDAFYKKNVSFENPKALYLYFELYVEQFKTGNKTITVEKILNKQFEIASKINAISETALKNNESLLAKQQTEQLKPEELASLKNNKEKIDNLKTVLQGNKSLSAPYSTCENWNQYCNANFEQMESNLFWLHFTATALVENNCFSDPVYAKIVSKCYEKNPNSKNAFNFGYLKLRQRKAEAATELFNESIAKSNDLTEKTETLYTIATTVYGINNQLKAKEYLDKIIALNPKYGKAYLYLAQLYQNYSSECTRTEFEKKAINWLLIETVEKAAKAESIYKATAEKYKESYSKYLPTEQEVNQSGLKGKSITFKCWFTETIQIPSK